MALTSSHLALLIEIERTGSLARAALNLSITPPAVSQQLARIEREVGAPLVDRGARGTRLTPLGQSLARHGVIVAAELMRAEETAAEFIGAHVNRLRVGAPPSMCATLLPDVLAATTFNFPDAELSVSDTMSDAGWELVGDGLLDVALTADYGHRSSDERVRSHHLLSDELLVGIPDDHALGRGDSDEPIDLSELAGATWVSGPPGRPSRSQLDDAAAERGFVPHVPFQTESYDVAQALTEAGVAVSLIPRLALRNLPRTKFRPLRRRLSREVYAVLPNNDTHIPLAHDFLVRLRNVAQANRVDP